jgi:uncharacterized protein HemY
MASNGQILIVLMVGWAAFFAFGWSAKEIFGKSKAKRYWIKRRRKYRVVKYSFSARG